MITLKNKKKIVIIALFLFTALTLAIGLRFASSKKKVARADEYTPYFAIEDGISIKLNEDGGMRFIAKMDTTIGQALIDGEKTMQFIIAPTAIFDYAENKGIEFINLPQKILVDVDPQKVYPDNADEPTCYYANGCVTKMNEANFNLTYEAVGYVVGERYTERNSNATGTYYEKVNATFLNQNVEEQILSFDRYDSWYGTNKYPIHVKNITQYDRLVSKYNAGNTAYNEKVIICENEVQWDNSDFTNQEIKPTNSNYYTVTYTDANGEVYETYKVAEGAKAPKPAMNPSKGSDEGYKYKFNSWDKDNVAWDFDLKTVNENVTLTPNFAKTAIEYTITYHSTDGATNINPTTYTIETETFEFEKAIKDGCYFDGWYTDASFVSSFSGIEKGTTGNKEVYGSFINAEKWTNGVSDWQGDNLGSSLNSSEVVNDIGEYNIYKTNGGYGQSIVNKSIDVSKYAELYFAFKANQQVTLSNGDYDKNVITPNTWYFVKLEKKTDGSWAIFAKAFGESDYTEFTASTEFFGANATFESMFRTYLWTPDTYNHEVYATDVWGVGVVESEISSWKNAGARKIGSALNSSDALTETLEGLAVYKTNGGYGQSIVNKSIDVSIYTSLYFAFKATAQVNLSNGDYDKNVITPNTWYFVKLEKQIDGSWTISAKKVGDGNYTAWVASTEFFGAGNATFETMFRTYLWTSDTYNHEVYATDVWAVGVVGDEITAWETEGAEKLGSALNSSDALSETLGGLAVYKTNGGFNYSIANLDIQATIYSKLYFAYKTSVQVSLSNTDGQNVNTANTWYFVKLEKQESGNWTISVKKVGDSDYTALIASDNYFGAGNATFDSMFRTNLWIADAMQNNHEVYATDVWGVSIVGDEITAWETEGAEKLGSALNSNVALTETLGGFTIYKTNGGYGQSIVNTSIDASIYTSLYFAFKATAQVNLSNGDYDKNVITPNTWYYVKLEKQTDGSWTISVKKIGDSEYTAWVASTEFFGAGKATFETMFRTYLWTADTYNHEVYATDVWGKTVAKSEVIAWETEGAVNLGSALNSNVALTETLYGLTVYKTNGGYGQSIVNTSINASIYSSLRFAFKATKEVTLSNGNNGVNVISPNVWYFVKLERQAGGSWSIFTKALGKNDYTEFVASEEFFSGNATFETMFRTYLWTADTYNHEVYATNVWGVVCDDSNLVWNGTTYKCDLCQKVFGTVSEELTETEEIVLYTNATYAGKGASGNAFDASVGKSITIDLSMVTDFEISGITNVRLNGVSYTVVGLEDNKVTIDGVVPYDVFGEYTFTAQITVKGETFNVEKPILVITDLITSADGLLNVRKVLRGQDGEITYDTANPVENLVIGGTGGLGTMNGRGYYKLGANIDLANYSISAVGVNTTNSYNRVFVFGTTTVPFSGTFDGAGYVLNNFISKPNFWNYNVTTGFTYLFQDAKGVTADSRAHEIEASLFGMVDGTIKNLAITNAIFGQNGNVVNGGNGGRLENVYVQINDLQADANVFVAPIAQYLGASNNLTLTNVVIDLTKHSSEILNGTSSNTISTHYPSIIGLGAVNIENVGVFGFNTAWVDPVTGRGSVYANSNVNTKFWQISLDPTIWKIVDGVPMLLNVSASGTVTDKDSWAGEVGETYNIAWNDEVAGSYDAVTKIIEVTTQVKTEVLGVSSDEDANIIVGTYGKYAEVAGVDVSELATDGRVNYGVYSSGGKVYVLADGEEGFYFASDMLLRKLYGYNELSNGSFTWTTSTVSLEDVENATAQIAFSNREPANGYNSGDLNFNGTKTYTTYGTMHNALDFLYATDGSGNVTGSDIVSQAGKNDANQSVTYTTTSYWLSSDCDDVRDGDNIAGEQLCYLAHGDKTAFNALVDYVASKILEIAKARPTMTAINFMIEDDPEYCMCSTCKSFYNPSIPQLLFLNTVAEKLEKDEYLVNSCRTIDIVFFAYASYTYAPITSTAVASNALTSVKNILGLSDTATETVSFTYANMNKAGATYTSATDTTTRNVLKAHKNLRLQWTTDKAFHSYALTHEANSTTYLELMAWLASVDSYKTEVFMYQTTFLDYFLPLNTWKYQVEWYKNLNDMGVNGYIFNLGDVSNPTGVQTGFSAFKTYIDSRAMTDSTVTYEQLKDEFFGVNGYYGSAGPTMRTFFEELEIVMDGKRQTSNYFDIGKFSYYDYDATDYPYYHYYTDGTREQVVITSQADRVQAWFNGSFKLPQAGILFGDLSNEDFNVATSVGKYENPTPIHAALTLSPLTDVYRYGEKTQLETLKAWYQYCVTAKGMVASDSIYAKRIQVESWFAEYALRLFHSTYTVNFNLTKGSYSASSVTYNYSAECTGVTSTLSEDTGLSRSATDFYNELIAFGVVRPSEVYAFDTAEKLSLGWVLNFYRNDGTTVFKGANCVCEISASSFVNWGAC